MGNSKEHKWISNWDLVPSSTQSPMFLTGAMLLWWLGVATGGIPSLKDGASKRAAAESGAGEPYWELSSQSSSPNS